MFVLIIFLTFFVCVYSDKESCLPLSSCKCKHSKGIIDLSPLHGQTFSAWQQDETLEFTFFPCKQTESLGDGCDKSKNNAVCSKKGNEIVSYGVQSGVEFIIPNTEDYGVTLAMFTPQNGNQHSSEVYLKCQQDKKTTTTQLKVAQVQNNNVQLELTSIHACYFTPQSHPPGPWGSYYLLVAVIVIIIVTIIVVLVTTTVYRYSTGIRGVKLINHTENCLGGLRLFVDGCRTLFSCFPGVRKDIGVNMRGGYTKLCHNMTSYLEK